MRLRKILEKVNTADPPPERLRHLRAVEVLEDIGSPEAREVLRRLARGTPQAWLTRASRDALGRLEPTDDNE